MNPLVSVLFAQASGTLISDTFVAWFAVLGGAAGFVSLAITIARTRAGTRPMAAAVPVTPKAVAPAVAPAVALTPLTVVTPPSPVVDDPIPGEVIALISAAVALTLGREARIASVVPVPAPAVELLQQWSIEGRRQIYSSHQIR